MGFKQFYSESLFPDEEDFQNILKEIEKNCKPFLRHKKALYRGMNTENVDDFGIKKVRKDRQPLGGNMELSAFTNAFIDSKKLPNRSKSIFALTNDKFTRVFGDTHLIFPKGNFKAVWFPGIGDMNSGIFGMFTDFLKTLDQSIFKKPWDDQFHEVQKAIIADGHEGTMRQFNKFITALENYNNKSFPKDTKYDEVIIDCKEYYFIRDKFTTDEFNNIEKAIKHFGLK